MCINTKTLESIRDEAFKKAQSMEFNELNDMYKIRPYYELSYAVEKFLKATTHRVHPMRRIEPFEKVDLNQRA
jgi:hypothetical protein